MRLNNRLRQYATEELLTILGSRPAEWVPTKELIGTPHFHGTRTLSARQVTGLLRASGMTEERAYTYGPYTQIVWRTKTTDWHRHFQQGRGGHRA